MDSSLLKYIHCRAMVLVLILIMLHNGHIALGADGPEIVTSGDILPHGVRGMNYVYQLESKGGQSPLKWEQSTEKKLPEGLDLDKLSGRIYGVPTGVTSQTPIGITVKDGAAPEKIHSRTFYMTVFPDAAARDAAINSECFTDVGEKAPAGDLSSNISVGPTVTTQLLRYNFATEKASINAKGLGVGAAFRFYNSNDMDAAPGSSAKDIRRIRPSCRATTLSTFDGGPSKVKASSWLSVSPVIFASVDEVQGSAASEVSVQPALMVGFLRDLINVGVGWNLAGPNRGQVFLLMGIGTGFKF